MTDASPTNRLLILSENPIDGIWTQLSVWQSQQAAKRHIEARAQAAELLMDADLIEAKSAALSYCLRTAQEYLRKGEEPLTSRIVSRYYGCLWLASAILASDPANDITLERLERFTKFGHGLGNIVNENENFPDNEYTYIKSSGFFPQFLKGLGLTPEQVRATQLPTQRLGGFEDVPKSEFHFLVSLSELLARIPELHDLYEYVTGRPALSFAVHYSSINQSENFKDAEKNNTLSAAPARTRDYSWISMPEEIPKDHLLNNGPPLEELEIREFAGHRNWTGKLSHPAGEYWYDHLQTYKSAMSQTCWVRPALGEIKDALPLHLMLLYQLSILARYRPAVWREILQGSWDQYSALIDAYTRVFDRVVPEMALRSIFANRVHVTTPGSMFAPI
ncbi:YaaC family protein [Microvirga arabica]|uniref:YaaC family protein n=1 Tax=Microvirga arabica TaxID=1128671 RepID=A0ABV6Y2E7_9HYPH